MAVLEQIQITHGEVRATSKIRKGLETLVPKANRPQIKLLNNLREMVTMWLKGVLSSVLLSHQ